MTTTPQATATPVVGPHHRAASSAGPLRFVPPAPLLSRLLFRPAASGHRRRQARRGNRPPRHHRAPERTGHAAWNSARGACMCAPSRSDELLAAMYAMREKRAGLSARTCVRSLGVPVPLTAASFVRQQVRPARRIWLLDRAMQAESVRQEATNRREARLCTLREGLRAGRGGAAGARVAKLSARVLVATDRLNRCHLAASRRVAHLADVVCKAQLASGQLTRVVLHGGGGNRHHSGKCTGNTLANNRSSNHVATLISAYVTDVISSVVGRVVARYPAERSLWGWHPSRMPSCRTPSALSTPRKQLPPWPLRAPWLGVGSRARESSG